MGKQAARKKARIRKANSQVRTMSGLRKRLVKTILADIFGEQCFYCGTEIPIDELTIDHDQALCLDGDDSYENLRLSCVICNQARGIYQNAEMRLNQLVARYARV